MINANTNAIELTDAELEQVVGGCGCNQERGDYRRDDDDRDPRRGRRHHRGHQHQHG